MFKNYFHLEADFLRFLEYLLISYYQVAFPTITHITHGILKFVQNKSRRGTTWCYPLFLFSTIIKTSWFLWISTVTYLDASMWSQLTPSSQKEHVLNPIDSNQGMNQFLVVVLLIFMKFSFYWRSLIFAKNYQKCHFCQKITKRFSR